MVEGHHVDAASACGGDVRRTVVQHLFRNILLVPSTFGLLVTSPLQLSAVEQLALGAAGLQCGDSVTCELVTGRTCVDLEDETDRVDLEDETDGRAMAWG